MKRNMKIGIIILAIIILLCVGIITYKIYRDKKEYGKLNKNEETDDKMTINIDKEEKNKEVEIFKGNDRPIAVMIDNHKKALPQGGLNDAYIVYEIIVEGGESRLMALYKGTKLEKIGPIRSARHYFLDYALENDAIYTHFGWSPQAEYDIEKLGVNNINGIFESEKSFWRTKDKYAPHNVATSTEKILQIAERKDYKIKSNKESILKYVTEEVNLENGEKADNIIIPYSDYNKVKYKYNPETKRYQRFSKGVEEVDWSTKENITTKNIIITFARNTTLNDGENKDRQNLHNIGKLDGYYITNGKAIKIICEKTSRTSKTIYRDLEGNEINVNDGNTFVQICPIDAKVKIEASEKEKIMNIE